MSSRAGVAFRKWCGSSSELAASGDVDCIATAVVDAGHAAAALPALERNLPVFAEKPLARTLAEAEAMRAAACAAGVPALVNFSKRNAPALALARRLVAEGRIGRVTGGSFSYLQSWLLQDSWGRWDITPRWRWRVSPATSTDGIIGDLVSHVIDAVRFTLGDIDAVSCRTTSFAADPEDPARPGSPDTCSAVFHLASGPAIAVRTSWRAAGYQDSFFFGIQGDAGTIEADFTVARDAVRVFDLASGAWSEVRAGPSPSTYELFIEAVRLGTRVLPDFEDGVAVQRVIDACSRSAQEGSVETLPPGDRA